MTIRITEDEDESGGYAFIDLGRSAPSPLLSFRRQDAEPRHLGAEGWQPEIAWLTPLSLIERDGRAIARFGPNVVDRIEELVPIEIVAQDGTSFGVVAWPSITPAPIGQGPLAASPTSAPALTEVGKQVDHSTDAVSEPTPPKNAPEADPVGTPVTTPETTEKPGPRAASPKVGRRVWPIAAMLLLALALAAGGGAYLYRDRIADRLAHREGPPYHFAAPETPPSPPTATPAPRVSAAELRQRYARLIDERAAPSAFLELGDTALASEQGGTAFRAFEEADPVTNADAAWQLARFYDPGNVDAAYRAAVRPNVVRAAHYYALWRNRSPRHTDALRGLCEANAELAGRDDRLRAICRP